jgi:hypothetical protein
MAAWGHPLQRFETALPERGSDILPLWVLHLALRERRRAPMTGTEDYYRERAPEYDQVYLKLERQEDLRSIRA